MRRKEDIIEDEKKEERKKRKSFFSSEDLEEGANQSLFSLQGGQPRYVIAPRVWLRHPPMLIPAM